MHGEQPLSGQKHQSFWSVADIENKHDQHSPLRADHAVEMKQSLNRFKPEGAVAPSASIDRAMRLIGGEGLHKGGCRALVVLSRVGVG